MERPQSHFPRPLASQVNFPDELKHWTPDVLGALRALPWEHFLDQLRSPLEHGPEDGNPVEGAGQESPAVAAAAPAVGSPQVGAGRAGELASLLAIVSGGG